MAGGGQGDARGQRSESWLIENPRRGVGERVQDGVGGDARFGRRRVAVADAGAHQNTARADRMARGDVVPAIADDERTREIDVEIGSLLLLANVTHARQVHVFFRSRMRSPDFGVTHESLEVALIDEKDIPWRDLAFPSTEFALRRFVEDRKAGIDRHHVAQMQRRF